MSWVPQTLSNSRAPPSIDEQTSVIKVAVFLKPKMVIYKLRTAIESRNLPFVQLNQLAARDNEDPETDENS